MIKELIKGLVVFLLQVTQLYNSFEGAGSVINEAIVKLLLYLTLYNTNYIV